MGFRNLARSTSLAGLMTAAALGPASADHDDHIDVTGFLSAYLAEKRGDTNDAASQYFRAFAADHETADLQTKAFTYNLWDGVFYRASYIASHIFTEYPERSTSQINLIVAARAYKKDRPDVLASIAQAQDNRAINSSEDPETQAEYSLDYKILQAWQAAKAGTYDDSLLSGIHLPPSELARIKIALYEGRVADARGIARELDPQSFDTQFESTGAASLVRALTDDSGTADIPAITPDRAVANYMGDRAYQAYIELEHMHDILSEIEDLIAQTEDSVESLVLHSKRSALSAGISGYTKMALARARIALHINPDNGPAHTTMAALAMGQDYLDTGLYHLERAPADLARQDSHYVRYALTLIHNGRETEALQLVEDHMLSGKDPFSVLSAADILLKAGHYGRAAGIYSTAAEMLQPRGETASSYAYTYAQGYHHFARAIALGSEEDNTYDDSLEEMRRAVQAMPDNAAFLNALGYSLASSDIAPDEGLAYLEKAWEFAPGDPALADSLAWAHYKNGDIEKALGYSKIAIEEMPNNAEVLYHTGVIHGAAGYGAAARNYLLSARDMAEKYPHTSTAGIVNEIAKGLERYRNAPYAPLVTDVNGQVRFQLD